MPSSPFHLMIVFNRKSSRMLQNLCLLFSWANKFHEDVREQLQPFAAPPSQRISSEERKQRWEAGQIDYMGDDSFANIEQKLNSFLK